MADAEDMEAKISSAMRERTSYFKEQADLLTLEAVRRLLEKDMGLKKCDLDMHKRFIKKCLEECFQSLNDITVSSDRGEVETKDATNVDETEIKGNKEVQVEEEKMEPNSEAELKKDDSTNSSRNAEIAPQKEISPCAKRKRDVSEDSVIMAVKKRASYFKENAETITLVKVRRLLEEDLDLEKYALDSFKSLIGTTLDEVLQNENSEMDDEPSKKNSKKESNGRDRRPKASTMEESDELKRSKDSKSSIESESEDEDGDDGEEPEPKRKKTESKQKIVNSKRFRNGSKKGEVEKSSNQKKRKKPLESDHEDNDEPKEDEHSKGSSGKRRKEVSTNVYGKRVQHLKSVIKACGINVPPSVYKKVKQASESERDHCLAMELEDILGREGLSANPSEKEIKAVKRSKERAKELEGIDMSNIISNARRRSTSNFILPTPKPKEPVASDSDEGEGSEDEEEDDDDDDNDDNNSEQSSEDLKNDGGDESN